MAKSEPQDTIYTFPDRAIRKLQAVPAHLRELVQEVAPNVAPHLRFEQARPVGGKLSLPDWREVEPDLLFEVPLDWPGAAEAMLVCVLLEHQSKPAQRMPLRVLQYATAYWVRRADEWEKHHQRGDRLTLPPVLPIVLYTGEGPWGVQRSLAELFTGPQELLDFQPRWSPLYFDLSTHDPEALLQRPGAWLPTLALVRVEKESPDVFWETLRKLLGKLESLGETEKARLNELLTFVVSWCEKRRPAQEYPQLAASVEQSVHTAALKEEILSMSKVMWQSWQEETIEKIQKAAEEADGAGELKWRLREARDLLRRQLETRFGPLPEAVINRIESHENLEILRTAVLHASELKQLEDLQL